MVPQIEQILDSFTVNSFTAVFLLATMPAWAIPVGAYMGSHYLFPVKSPKHGILLFWDLMSKVDVIDLYRCFKKAGRDLPQKYTPLIERHIAPIIWDSDHQHYYYAKE